MPILQAGIGTSQKNLIEGVKEAAKEAKRKVKNPELLIFFCTYNYPPQDYQAGQKEIQNIFSKKVPLVGGAVGGIYAKGKVFHAFATKGKERGLAILALSSEYLSIGVGLADKADINPQKAGRSSILQALENLDYNPSVAYLAMMKRGIKDIARIRPINGLLLTPGIGPTQYMLENEFLRGIASIVGANIIRIAGGGTSGVPEVKKAGLFFPKSFQFFNGKVYNKAVISVVFGSDLEMGYGVGSGYSPLGPGLFVTKAEENILYELNGQPAAEAMGDILEKYTTIKKNDFFKSPVFSTLETGFIWGQSEIQENFFWPLSSPLRIIDKKYVAMGIKLNVGDALSLLRTDEKSLIKADEEASQMLVKDARTKEIELAFIFSSVSRKSILKSGRFEEEKSIRKIIGQGVKIFGIGTVGEIGTLLGLPPRPSGKILSLCGISNTLVTEERGELENG